VLLYLGAALLLENSFFGDFFIREDFQNLSESVITAINHRYLGDLYRPYKNL
jgi:hypothetical protein